MESNLPDQEKETKKDLKKPEHAEIEWKPDKSQIVTIEETLHKVKEKEKKK